MENQERAYSQYDLFRPQPKDPNKSSDYFGRNFKPLIESLNLPKSARILEIGPGSGQALDFLRTHGFANTECFETCEAFASDLKKRGYRVFSVKNLQQLLQELADNSYDLLIAIDVFEHVPRVELQEFLFKFHKKLKPNGAIIGQVPNSSGLFGHTTFIADFTHVTAFNEISLKALLNGCGYNEVKISETQLPYSVGNFVRGHLRKVIFLLCSFLARLVAATPTKLFSHLIIFKAKK